jgi:type IV pilus biogenesis protein CpaD/CtpE
VPGPSIPLRQQNDSRLEEQHSAELRTYQEELETAKQDMVVVQEQLKQQAEAAITILRAQLQDKEAKQQLLSQTVTELQVCP